MQAHTERAGQSREPVHTWLPVRLVLQTELLPLSRPGIPQRQRPDHRGLLGHRRPPARLRRRPRSQRCTGKHRKRPRAVLTHLLRQTENDLRGRNTLQPLSREIGGRTRQAGRFLHLHGQHPHHHHPSAVNTERNWF